MKNSISRDNDADPAFSSFPAEVCQEEIYVDNTHVNMNSKRTAMNKERGMCLDCHKRHTFRMPSTISKVREWRRQNIAKEPKEAFQSASLFLSFSAKKMISLLLTTTLKWRSDISQ